MANCTAFQQMGGAVMTPAGMSSTTMEFLRVPLDVGVLELTNSGAPNLQTP